MTIHAFAGERGSRTHENQMLHAFLERLESRWADSTDWIYVIANAMWEGAEVDLVCVLPCAILVADFKNYKGRLTGSENGAWRADGVPVKGGSKENPFVQIRDNKFSVMDWINRKGFLTGRNIGHISGCVVFNGPIRSEVDVADKAKSWFRVTDFDHCVDFIDSLASPSLTLKEDEAAEIVRALGVAELRWRRSRPSAVPIGGKANAPSSRSGLTPHQQEAVGTIASFLESHANLSLSVLGMTSTGKSRVLAEVIDVAAKQGRQAIALAPNRRLAVLSVGVDCESIFQHLFDPGLADRKSKEMDKRAVKVMPLRQCIDPEDCIYLVDEAHLLSNQLFQTADGKQFGSGHLLADLFDFARLGESKRQIIFFGDPYQLRRGSATETVLEGGFQSIRNIPHQQIELNQLIDTTEGSAGLANARKIVEAIRTQQFSTLLLAEDASFRLLGKQGAAKELFEQFKTDPFSVWYVAETHVKVGEFTRWLRSKLHEKTTLDSIEPGELLEIFTIPVLESSDPFNDRAFLQAGQRIRVERAELPRHFEQSLKGRPAPTRFTTRSCPLSAPRAGHLNLLEDFLLADKPELPADTLIALDVWCKSNEHRGFANARYGYATNAHHAQGMKQPLCYVNAELAAGRHSEGYFRWLYTAVTRADRSAVVFNFEPIHPFDSATWNPAAAQQSANIPVGTGWQFDPAAPISEHDQKRDVPTGFLEQSKDPRISVAVWLRIAGGVEEAGWRIAKVISHSYQEQLELAGPGGESIRLKIAYNSKNVVTGMHLSDPAQWQLLSTIAVRCLMESSYSPSATMLLAALQSRVNPHGWQALSVSETNYRLVVTLAQGPDARVSLELNLDKQGLVSSIRPLQFSELALLDQIRSILL